MGNGCSRDVETPTINKFAFSNPTKKEQSTRKMSGIDYSFSSDDSDNNADSSPTSKNCKLRLVGAITCLPESLGKNKFIFELKRLTSVEDQGNENTAQKEHPISTGSKSATRSKVVELPPLKKKLGNSHPNLKSTGTPTINVNPNNANGLMSMPTPNWSNNDVPMINIHKESLVPPVRKKSSQKVVNQVCNTLTVLYPIKEDPDDMLSQRCNSIRKPIMEEDGNAKKLEAVKSKKVIKAQGSHNSKIFKSNAIKPSD